MISSVILSGAWTCAPITVDDTGHPALGDRQFLEPVGARLERRRIAPHRRGALLHRQPGPVARVERAARRGDRGRDLRVGRACDLGDHRFVRRVLDGEGLALCPRRTPRRYKQSCSSGALPKPFAVSNCCSVWETNERPHLRQPRVFPAPRTHSASARSARGSNSSVSSQRARQPAQDHHRHRPLHLARPACPFSRSRAAAARAR